MSDSAISATAETRATGSEDRPSPSAREARRRSDGSCDELWFVLIDGLVCAVAGSRLEARQAAAALVRDGAESVETQRGYDPGPAELIIDLHVESPNLEPHHRGAGERA